MSYLPTPEDQEWLLRHLAELIRLRGIEAFVRAPIVEPTAAYFPDPIGSLAVGLDRVTRRLLQYAGLGALEVRIEAFGHAAYEGATEVSSHHQIAGCFLGIMDGCCRFGLNTDMPGDVEYLAGVMAHEVAHAYRTFHQLCSDDREQEELLTDLTVTYLGFGVLSVNNSYRFRKSGYQEGALAHTSWSTSATGYLPPHAHCFLLASQIVARGLEKGQRTAIYRHLETNQAAFVKAAVKQLEEGGLDLKAALGLPPSERWPPPRKLEEILEPLKPYTPPEAASAAHTVEDHHWNEGRPVFRLPHSKALEYGSIGAGLFGLLGLIASQMLFRTWLGLLPFALVGFALGRQLARRGRRELCSDSACRTVLSAAETRCPGCGGEIMGRIDYEDQHLEMQERFAEAARLRPDLPRVSAASACAPDHSSRRRGRGRSPGGKSSPRQGS